MSEVKNRLTHFDDRGNARMVDVAGKKVTTRFAKAAATIHMSREAFELIRSGGIKKGDVLGVARIAGIMAAKKVDQLIPLTHPLMITKADIEYELNDDENSITILAMVGIDGKTGVEMEALTAATVTALTIYDMCKAVDKSMIIDKVCLLRKTGGKSGSFERKS